MLPDLSRPLWAREKALAQKWSSMQPLLKQMPKRATLLESLLPHDNTIKVKLHTNRQCNHMQISSGCTLSEMSRVCEISDMHTMASHVNAMQSL